MLRSLAFGFIALALHLTAQAEVIELEGTVKSIDKDARSISVVRKTPKGEKTLELEVAKKAGDLSEVKEGDTVAFSYDPDLELITKIGEERKPAKKAVALGDDDLARLFLDKLMKAVEENDYDSFIADTSAPYKATLKEATVAEINKNLARRMKNGYDIKILGQLNMRQQKMYIWKVTFSDGGDLAVTLLLKEGKVNGTLWMY